MARQKKPVHRVQMTEGKRNIIHQLLEEYLNKAISALVKKRRRTESEWYKWNNRSKWYIR